MNVTINWDIVLEVVKTRLVEELKQRCPIHDGELRNSITGKSTGNELLIWALEYWYYVEMGTAPHWTSVEHLKKWAKDKWGDENLAYALQRHIALFGTAPHPFVRDTIEQELVGFLVEGLKYPGAVSVDMGDGSQVAKTN